MAAQKKKGSAARAALVKKQAAKKVQKKRVVKKATVARPRSRPAVIYKNQLSVEEDDAALRRLLLAVREDDTHPSASFNEFWLRERAEVFADEFGAFVGGDPDAFLASALATGMVKGGAPDAQSPYSWDENALEAAKIAAASPSSPSSVPSPSDEVLMPPTVPPSEQQAFDVLIDAFLKEAWRAPASREGLESVLALLAAFFAFFREAEEKETTSLSRESALLASLEFGEAIVATGTMERTDSGGFAWVISEATKRWGERTPTLGEQNKDLAEDVREVEAFLRDHFARDTATPENAKRSFFTNWLFSIYRSYRDRRVTTQERFNQLAENLGMVEKVPRGNGREDYRWRPEAFAPKPVEGCLAKQNDAYVQDLRDVETFLRARYQKEAAEGSAHYSFSEDLLFSLYRKQPAPRVDSQDRFIRLAEVLGMIEKGRSAAGQIYRWRHEAFAPKPVETTPGPEAARAARAARVLAFLKDFWHGKVSNVRPGFNGIWIANSYLSRNADTEPPPWDQHTEVQRVALATGVVRAVEEANPNKGEWAWVEEKAAVVFGPRAVPTNELRVAPPLPLDLSSDEQHAQAFLTWFFEDVARIQRADPWDNAFVFGRYMAWTGITLKPLLPYAAFEKAMLRTERVSYDGASWVRTGKAPAAAPAASLPVPAFGEKWAVWNPDLKRFDLFDEYVRARAAAVAPSSSSDRKPIRVGSIEAAAFAKEDALASLASSQNAQETLRVLATAMKAERDAAHATNACLTKVNGTLRANLASLAAERDELREDIGRAFDLIDAEKPKAAAIWEKKKDRYAAGKADAYEEIDAILTAWRDDDKKAEEDPS